MRARWVGGLSLGFALACGGGETVEAPIVTAPVAAPVEVAPPADPVADVVADEVKLAEDAADDRPLVVDGGKVAVGSAVVAGDGSAPAKVVEDWLRAGGRGDLKASKALVVPECADEPYGRASPAQVLGVPVAISTLATSTSREAGDEAVVHFALTGAAKGAAGKTKTQVFGMDVEVDVADMNIDNFANEGEVSLVKRDGAWKITCE